MLSKTTLSLIFLFYLSLNLDQILIVCKDINEFDDKMEIESNLDVWLVLS